MSTVNTLNLPPWPASLKLKQCTKTFTGCWTCCAHCVKCDEHKPHCLRCHHSGWNCQGYNVHLGWLASYQGAISQCQIHSAGRQEEDNTLSVESLADIFTGLDSYSGDVVSERNGPFSVFSVGLLGSKQSWGWEDSQVVELCNNPTVGDVHDVQINSDLQDSTMEDVTDMANQQLFAMIPSETSDTTTEEFAPVSESPAAVVLTPSVTNIGRLAETHCYT